MDIDGGAELSGAHIQILDKDGKVVEEWDSEAGKPHEVTGLNMGEEYTENPTINPTQDIIDRCEFFHDIPDDFMKIYTTFWQQVKNAR